MKKTFDSQGYNYTSSTRITKIAFPETDNSTFDEKNSSEKLTARYIKKGVDVIRGFSLGINGAIDYRNQIKSEATYDLHYNRDNVEISIKFPFMFDYSTKTLYMGKSFLNTVFPMKTEDEGKLIRFDLNDSLISTLIGKESMKQFDNAKVHALNNAIKEGTIKAFSDMNRSLFTYQPLTEKEKYLRSTQKIHLSLDRNQTMTMVLTIADSMIQKMYSESLITKETYGAYLLLSDPKQLELLTDGINVTLDFDFGVGSDGHIVYLLTRINTSDIQNRFALGMENTTTLENFNTPQFTLDPKRSGTIDYMEAFQNWKELLPDESENNPLEGLEKIVIPNGDPII